MSIHRSLSSSHWLVCQYFQTLRRYCTALSKQKDSASEEARQDTAVCITLSVQCVEVFLNVYFRRIADDERFAHVHDELMNDLKNRSFGLSRKIDKWPKLVFKRKIDKGSVIGRRFSDLQKLRNGLMHFQHDNISIEMPGLAVHGLSDTTAFDSLTAETALDALDVAESFALEIFKLQGVPETALAGHMRRWTGKWLVT